MKKLWPCLVAMMLGSYSWAAVECTKEPVKNWKDQKAFQQELAKSYKIKKFKVTEGNCYEIYGHDKSGKRVEIYFNPVNGEIVKQKD